MKKMIRLGLCLGVLAAALTCSALAAEGVATDGWTTANENCTVTYADGKYTASYAGTIEGNQYALLVVKAKDGVYEPISDDTIMYIDQKRATETGVSFEFIPKSTPDCVVLLGGVFEDKGGEAVTSPVTLGTLEGKGVTVSGSVALQGRSNHSGATVTLSDGSGTVATTQTGADGGYTFDSVEIGDYTLTITMPGYLSYTKTSLTVDEITQVESKTLQGGDVNETPDNYVNADDLLIILDNFIKEIKYPAMDINNDGYINVDELGIVLDNFTKQGTIE